MPVCALKSLSLQYNSRNLQNDTSLESTSIWIKEAPVETHESFCLRSLGVFFFQSLAQLVPPVVVPCYDDHTSHWSQKLSRLNFQLQS